ESRRWRGSRPFQIASVPGVAGDVTPLVASAYRDHDLRDLRDDAEKNNEHAYLGENEPGMPLGHVIMLKPPRHALEADDVPGRPGHPEADQPQPEGPLAEPLIQHEAERLGEPVGVPGEHPEEYGSDDDVVEVRDQEDAVMELEVSWRHGEQHARHAADRKGHHEADRPQHRRGEAHR